MKSLHVCQMQSVTFLLIVFALVTTAAGRSQGKPAPSQFQIQQVNYLINGGQFFSPSVVTADFNHDGNLDIAVSNDERSTGSSISVLLGNGDGTLQVPKYTAVGSDPRAMAVGDFNGDGNPDLAVVNEEDGTISILLGNGDGTFQPQQVYKIGSNPIHLVTGDFNGDGKLDIAVAVAGTESKVAVLLGNGDGTFQTPRFTDEPNGPYAITAGDFNKDGKLDIAVADYCCGSVSVLLGNGDGTFKKATEYTLAYSYPFDIVAADFNGDGKLDLAVSDNSLTIFLGKGDGTFQAGVDYGSNLTLQGLSVGDFNKDGKIDIAGSENGGRTATLFAGNGDGTFQSPSSFGSFGQAEWMAIGDFNRDGLIDFAVSDSSAADNVDLLLQGNGKYVPTANLSVNHIIFKLKVGERKRKIVILSNKGNAPLDISSIGFINNRSGFFHEKNTCGAALYPGTECHINVTFFAAAKQRYTATLVIADNAENSPQEIPLVGIGD
jgi:hypothetical protein